MHQARFESRAAGIDPEAEGIRHRHGVGGLCNRRVEQHRVVAELERFGRMRLSAFATERPPPSNDASSTDSPGGSSGTSSINDILQQFLQELQQSLSASSSSSYGSTGGSSTSGKARSRRC